MNSSITLYLCEKPSQARDIARVVGASQKIDGALTNGSSLAVTWGFGHLLEMAPPDAYNEAYKKWSLDHLPILPDSWLLLPKKSSVKQLRVIEGLIKKANQVVIATDADREGETIAREILEKAKYKGKLSRLWLSALDDASIRKAVGNLLPGSQTESLYHAGMARARADWMVGMNLTRAYTVLGRSAGGDSLLSVGRVQTPTLRLVVDRDREIANFQSKPYWDVLASLSYSGHVFTAKWMPPESLCDPEGRCTNEQAARELCVQAGQDAEVTDVDQSDCSESPPLLFDLGSLQQEASRRWGMGAQEVLDVAQALYEKHKATTYPRSDCGYLPTSMIAESDQVLQAMEESDPSIAALIQQADRSLRSRAWNDKKITAHHGIIPTMVSCDIQAMTQAEKRIYDAIRLRYLAQFYPPHGYQSTVVSLLIADNSFKAKGKLITNVGWRVLWSSEKESDDNSSDQQLPSLSRGDRCKISGIEVKDRKTKPPKHFAEGTLIGAMKQAAKWVSDPQLKAMLKETSGLGTEATRAGIIKTLIDRGFIEKKKRSLISTSVAGSLVDALPEPVKDPAMTALWEQALDDIAQGNGDHEDFLARQSDWVSKLVARAIKQAPQITAPGTQHTCPDCGKNLLRRKGSNGYFWGCTGYPDCNTTLPDVKGKPGSALSKEPLVQCQCGGEVKETPKAWSCDKCKATVWKVTAGKSLSEAVIKSLFAGQQVAVKGFKSKAGKRFNADLVLRDGKTEMVFPE